MITYRGFSRHSLTNDRSWWQRPSRSLHAGIHSARARVCSARARVCLARARIRPAPVCGGGGAAFTGGSRRRPLFVLVLEHVYSESEVNNYRTGELKLPSTNKTRAIRCWLIGNQIKN